MSDSLSLSNQRDKEHMRHHVLAQSCPELTTVFKVGRNAGGRENGFEMGQ